METERAELQQFLQSHFTLDELRDLVFDLGVDFELFRLETAEKLAHGLIVACEHRNILGCLVTKVLKRRDNDQLAQMLTKLPPCSPRTKVQIIISGDSLRLDVKEKFQEVLATKLDIEQEAVALVSAAWGESVRLLIGLPEKTIDTGILSEILAPLGHQVLSSDSFWGLDPASQNTWRLVAHYRPPVRQNNILRPTVSWKSALGETFAPSSLLCYEQVSPAVQTLLVSSRDFRLKYEWSRAEQCALHALEICGIASAHVGSALTLIHLADFYREVGELGKAMEECETAYQILRRQPARVQRHNEAIAAYARGLLHELRLFGDDMQALYWYQEALKQLERAQEHWATRNDRSQVNICQQIRQWIETRSDRIVQRHTDQHPWQPVFDIWRPGNVGAPFAKDSGLLGCIADDNHILINGNTYHIHSGNLPDCSTGNAYYHFALPVRKEDCAVLESQVGDYAFIRQQWQVEEQTAEGRKEEEESRPGVVWEPGDGWFMGNFKREPDGTITFVSPSPKIIGGDPAGKLKGYITALLRPGPPPLRPPTSPLLGPSADPTEPYGQLLRMVGGDRETANRLIEHERELRPDASLPELVDSAIAHLTRDRR